MPLYAFDHCGFTSAAFRTDAAAAHRLEYPDCDGVIRIIFRSDQRSRGPTYASAAGAHAGRSEQPRGPSSSSPTRASIHDTRTCRARRNIAPYLAGRPRPHRCGRIQHPPRRAQELRLPSPSRPLKSGFHRQHRNPSPTPRADRRPLDRMAGRRRSKGQPQRPASSPDHRDRPSPVAARPRSEPDSQSNLERGEHCTSATPAIATHPVTARITGTNRERVPPGREYPTWPSCRRPQSDFARRYRRRRC